MMHFGYFSISASKNERYFNRRTLSKEAHIKLTPRGVKKIV